MYHIQLHKRVIKFIESRTPKDKQKIKEKFLQLQKNPYPSNPQDELLIYIDKGDNRGDIY